MDSDGVMNFGAGDALDDAALRLCLGWSKLGGQWYDDRGNMARMGNRLLRPSQRAEDCRMFVHEIARRTKAKLQTTTDRQGVSAHWTHKTLANTSMDGRMVRHPNELVAKVKASVAFFAAAPSLLRKSALDGAESIQDK